MEPYNYIEVCLEKFSRLKMNFERYQNQSSILSSNMIEIYEFIKGICPYFFVNGKIDSSYQFLINELILCESLLRKFPLTNIKLDSNFDLDDSFDTCSSVKEILDKIVYIARKFIVDSNSYCNINDIDLTNNCKIVSTFINNLCNSLGIKSRLVKISPGFSEEANLLDGHGYHYFVIVTINNKEYLIDCTYSQFFNLSQNILQRIGIVGLVSCNPGTFMIMNNSRMQLAYQLLQNGWIEFNQENIKNYFDGFALSYRNGLYYEQNKDNKYTTNYTYIDYLNFINGQDNQINHESIETLGIQKRPLSYHM